MKRLVLGFLIVMLILSSCIPVASAAEITNSKNVSFTDVQSSDWYYGDVMSLLRKNVISGYPDGTFGAGKAITAADAITILGRIYGDPSASQSDGGWCAYAYNSRWFDSADIAGNFNQNITRGLAAKLLLSAQGVYPCYTSLYNISFIKDAAAESKYWNYFTTCILLDYFEGDLDQNYFIDAVMTREEFCSLVVRAQNSTAELPEPDYFTNVTIEIIGFDKTQEKRLILGAQASLLINNIEVLDKISSTGWKVVIANADYYNQIATKQYASKSYANSQGLYDPIQKTIFVNGSSSARTILHECGHFVYYYFANRKSVSALFDSESKSLGTLLNDEYCCTNAAEFFAEAYYAYLTQAAQMKTSCPETCFYIANLFDNPA